MVVVGKSTIISNECAPDDVATLTRLETSKSTGLSDQSLRLIEDLTVFNGFEKAD